MSSVLLYNLGILLIRTCSSNHDKSAILADGGQLGESPLSTAMAQKGPILEHPTTLVSPFVNHLSVVHQRSISKAQ